MADIQSLFDKLLNAVYGKDVRQTIVDAIHKCYEDGNAGAIDLIAREKIDSFAANLEEVLTTGVTAEVIAEKVQAVIDELIADGTMASLTIPEKGVEEKHLTDDLLTKLNDSGYLYDASGKRYSMFVVDGKVVATPDSNVVTDSLVYHLKVVDGVATDVVSNTEYDFEVTDGEIYIPKATNLFEIPNGKNFTVEYRIDLAKHSMNQWDGRVLNLNVDGVSSSLLIKKNGNDLYDAYVSSKYIMPDITTYFVGKGSKENRFIHNANTIRNNHLINTDMDVKITVASDTTGIINGVNDCVYTNSKNIINSDNVAVYGSSGGFSIIKEIRIYSKKLSKDEILQNTWADGLALTQAEGWESLYKYGDGLKLFGANPSYKTTPFSIYADELVDTNLDVGDYEEYSIKAISDYPNSVSNTKFKEIKFLNKPSEMRIGRKYSVTAEPYPFSSLDFVKNGNENEYKIEYSSSDSNVCECVEGILIPKMEGNVVITAKLNGTNITTSFSTTVVATDYWYVDENSTCYVPIEYTSGFDSLSSKNPKTVMRTIVKAIEEANEEGYKKIVFPKMDYYIYPTFECGDGDKICCYVPNEFVIDFSGSNIYIQDNPYCYWATRKDYILFLFAKRVKNSAIINANFYGERFYNDGIHKESEYQDHCGIVDFKDCYRCKIENVNMDSCVGFQLNFTESELYNYWKDNSYRAENYVEGIGMPNRGRLRVADFSFGKLSSTGDVEDSTTHICTPVMNDIGWYLDQCGKYFRFGHTGTTMYGVPQRWLNVFWYDSERNLINNGGTSYFQFEIFEIPQNAKYFKLCYNYDTLPTKNLGEDECVIRLSECSTAIECEVINSKITNNHGWSVTFVGGDSCYIADCVLSVSKVYGYCAIDMEDGFCIMRHNVIDHCMSGDGGFRCHAGTGNAVVSSMFATSYDGIHFMEDCESSRAINNTSRTLWISDKMSAVAYGNKYGTLKENAGVGKTFYWENEDLSSNWEY